MEWYHEGSHHGSRAGDADLGAELRPARLFRLSVVQLLAGEPELRHQRLLTSPTDAGQRLAREAAGPCGTGRSRFAMSIRLGLFDALDSEDFRTISISAKDPVSILRHRALHRILHKDPRTIVRSDGEVP